MTLLKRCVVRYIAVPLGVALVSVGAWAQAPDKAGPMQSGEHAGQPPPSGGAAPAGAAGGGAKFDVEQLFAGTCGWCHLKGGREQGKGPRLMGTELTDDEIIARIKVGKPGQMPAFGTAFTDEQMKAIVGYIRNLK